MIYNLFYLKKHFVLISALALLMSFSLSGQTKKEKRQQKMFLKKQKKIEKLKNPEWLIIKDSIGYFKDDKRSYTEMPSVTTSSERLQKTYATERSSFKNSNDSESRFGSYFLEKKIIQAVLFKTELKNLTIEIIATCNNGRLGGYEKLFLFKKEIEAIRKSNDIDNFLAGKYKIPFLVEQNISNSIKSLCF